MRFTTLATVFCLIAVLATLFTPEAESSHIRKLRLAKKLARMMLKGKTGKVLLALPFPLPLPLPMPLPVPVVKKIPLPNLLPTLGSLLPALSTFNAWPAAAASSWSAAAPAAAAWPAAEAVSSWASAAPLSIANYDAWTAPVAAAPAPVAWPAASSSAAISAESGYQSNSNYQEPAKTSYASSSYSSDGYSSGQQEAIEQQKTTSSGSY